MQRRASIAGCLEVIAISAAIYGLYTVGYALHYWQLVQFTLPGGFKL